MGIRKVLTVFLLIILCASPFFTIIHVEGKDMHDLEVSLEATRHLKSGGSMVVNMTVYNRGNVTEKSVSLQLLINGSIVVNSIVANLSDGGFYRSSYFWTPSEDMGIYILTAYAPPVPDEDYVSNNNVTTLVNVCPDEPPIVCFTYSPSRPVENELVTFNASCSDDPDWGTIISYRWNFSDGNVTTGDYEIITHSYTTYGNKSVTLTLFDSEELNNFLTEVIRIHAHPVARFKIHPPTEDGKYYVNQPLTFNASLSYDPDGNITTYFWDFGNGDNSNDTIANHTYLDDGLPNVNLTVWDNDTPPLTNSRSVHITVDLGVPKPVIKIFPDVPYYYVNQTLTFDASSSEPNGGEINSTRWDFGDGHNASDKIVPHSYRNAGNYNVTLNVTDTHGMWNDTSKTITIHQKPIGVTNIILSKTIVGQSYNVHMNVTVTNHINETETFNVTICYNTTISGPCVPLYTTNIILPAGGSTVIKFAWNTTDVAIGNYTINAYINTPEILYIDDTVKVRIIGDINADGYVEMMDNYVIDQAYGSTPDHPRWNANADIYSWPDGDYYIDMMDFWVVSQHYGEHYP